MTAREILEELRGAGDDGYRRILLKHGAAEPCFGVKIEELKKIQKIVRKDYRLALDLYDTGVYDAQYLAGLVADDAKMTKADLQHWAEKACGPLAGSVVPWVAAGSAHGWEMALKWIESSKELIAVAGWGTLSSLVAIREDGDLNLEAIRDLLQKVGREIHKAPNDVRYQMNGFVIAVGSHVVPLSEEALTAAETIGRVTVDMGNTACGVPFAPDYIRKVASKGRLGRKRKSAKC